MERSVERGGGHRVENNCVSKGQCWKNQEMNEYILTSFFLSSMDW